MEGYKHRIADALLDRKLKGNGAVVIEGPKWCGKTTTAEQLAQSVLYMDDPDKITEHITMANIRPRDLLLGDNPRLLDEWQIAPQLWDAIRFEKDKATLFSQDHPYPFKKMMTKTFRRIRRFVTLAQADSDGLGCAPWPFMNPANPTVP